MKFLYCLTIIFICLGLVAPLFGQEEFIEHIILDDIPIVDMPNTICTVDLDNDQDFDLVLASADSGRILWFQNDGKGNFTNQFLVSKVDNVTILYISDIDNDNDMDILSGSKNIIWHENDGLGHFKDHLISDDLSTIIDLRTADIDLDGDKDIFYALYNYQDSFYWYENVGDEQFIKRSNPAIPGVLSSIDIADMNIDGYMDIVIGTSDWDYLSWYENNGDFDFVEHRIGVDPFADVMAPVWNISVLDMDQDGDLDIFTPAGYLLPVSWWENDGTSQFIPHSLELYGWEHLFDAGRVTDLDLDGDWDVVASDFGKVCWWENDGHQNFTDYVIKNQKYYQTLPLIYSFNNSFDVGDFDGDGDVDIVCACPIDKTLKWYENHLEPIANFTADSLIGRPPLTVHFQDSSHGVRTYWEWWLWEDNNFESTFKSITGKNPSFTFDQIGTYTVNLYIEGPNGWTEIAKKNYITITDNPPPVARFNMDYTFGFPPLTVHFQDNSSWEITSWLWNFGDGDTSHVQNPVHEYTYADSFTVTLIVSGPGGSDTLSMPDYIIVQEQKPVAHFGLKQIIGLPPLTVEFTDSSTGVITSWLWDFGDGDTSHVQNPTHTYTNADTFTVTLTVSGPGGADTLSLKNLIIVLNPSAVENEFDIPTEFSLMPVYPNPFNPVANIRFSLPKQTHVKISIYNIYGEEVEQASLGLKQAGEHLFEWNASRFSTGTYLIRIQAGEFHDVRKCVLMK